MAFLWQNPEKLGDFPKLAEWLVDPLSKVVHNLIANGNRGNAVILASLVSKTFRPYTADQITSELLQLTDPSWGVFRPEDTAAQIETQYILDTDVGLLEETLVKVRTGQQSFEGATEVLYERAMSTRNKTDLEIISTSAWEDWGREQAEIQRERTKSGKVLRMSPNLIALARLIERIPDGMLVSYLAIPGSGKTSVAVDLAHHWGGTSGTPVMFCETELTPQQMFWRRMSAVTRIPFKDLEAGLWDARVEQAAKQAKKDGVLYLNTPNWTVQDIISAANKQKIKPHLFIDYMGMLSWNNQKGKTETQAIEEGLNYLKQYAAKHRVVVFCTWQTGKEGHAKPVLRAWDANGSYAPYTRSNLFLVGNFPIATEVTYLKDPFGPGNVVVEAGKPLPVGDIMIDKSTFSATGGVHQAVWRDEFFNLRGLDKTQAGMFAPYIEPMFRPQKAAWKS